MSSRSLFLAVPFVLLAPQAGELTFGPAAGTKLTKTFEIELEASLEKRSFEMNGKEVPLDEEADIEVESKTRIVFTDHYRTMAEGRPVVLARTFDELAGGEKKKSSSSKTAREESHDESSALEGRTVVFAWNDESDAFDRAYEGEVEGDAALLEGLVEDSDLRRFLPDTEVAEGDTWDIDPVAFAGVLEPGGDVALRPEEVPESVGTFQRTLRRNYSGEVKATFRGYREQDSVRVAVIGLDADVKAHGELMNDEDQERIDIESRIRGELLWHTEGKRPHQLSLAGPTRWTLSRSGRGQDSASRIIEYVQTILLKGTTDVQASWTTAD